MTSRNSVKALISAYACGPNYGSEIGMGWNWVTSLAKYCQLSVITEKGFRDQILDAIPSLGLEHIPAFHFIDVGKVARTRCWNQGDWRFYSDYRKWQSRAYKLASQLIHAEKYDIVHQLNMIGYREPGYLWMLPLPLVWGPIGGYVQMPYRFMWMLGPRGALFYTCRNILNSIQMRTSIRVRRAACQASVLISATVASQKAIQTVHGRRSILLNETAAPVLFTEPKREPYCGARPLRLIWCAKFIGLKALPIALQAVAIVLAKIPVELHIVGSGPYELRWRSLAKRIRVDSVCRWYGKVEHGRALSIIGGSDLMLFSSVQEGTPHVVLEALALGVPVICHDACGQAECVDEFCGIKIPMVNPRRSIEGFAQAIIQIGQNPEVLARLSWGAILRAKALSWDRKARQMVGIYQRVLDGAAGERAGQFLQVL